MESDHDGTPDNTADRDDPPVAEWTAKMIAAAERAGYRLHPDSNPPHTLLWQRVSDEPTTEPVWIDDLPDWLR
ncbi:hypothetical protein [Nocardia terpenica]|nr:hypothetical protein [Nocardia terpenica]